MTLKLRMILMNQFEHLFAELENAEEEINTAKRFVETAEDASFLNYISSDIYIAKQRVREFKIKAVKEFEKKHKEKIQRLNAKKKENSLKNVKNT